MENPISDNQFLNFDDDWEHIRTRSSSSSDDHLLIFPPSLHQDITIINTTHYSDQELPASPFSSSTSSQSSEPETKAWILGMICKRLGIRLRTKGTNLAAKFYFFVRLWKFGILSVVCLTIIWVISSRRWKQRRVAAEDVSALKKLIKEKDRVIDKLLLEIAHMNEELTGRRSVPVYRVS